MSNEQTRRTDWGFDLLETSEDKSGTRHRVERPASWELTGVDGAGMGGLRPAPPWARVRTLTPEDATWPDGASNPYDTDTHLTLVTDFFPVDFRVGSDDYAYGFVYRARRPDESTYDLFVETWDSIQQAWMTTLLTASSGLQYEHWTAQMDVAVTGRLVHVFIEGRAPLVFRLTGLLILDVDDPSGPGRPPQIDLLSPLNVTGSDQWYFDDEVTQPLPASTSAWVVVGTMATDAAVATVYPSSTFYSATTECATIEAGDYAIAVQFEDSQTGRRSPLSEIVALRKADFGGVSRFVSVEGIYDSTKWDRAIIWRSVRTQDAGGTFTAGILWKDQEIELYNEPYGRTSDPYSLTGVGHFLYFYNLRDKVLPYQDAFTDPVSFLETLPPGGAVGVQDSTLLVSGIRNMPAASSAGITSFDGLRGAGEIRWSSVTMPLPEMFPPQNKWFPPSPKAEPIRFMLSGPVMMGFAKDRVYQLYKDAGFMRAMEMHVGYGILGPRAATQVGGTVVYATPKGLKQLAPNGQLVDMAAVDALFVEDGWDGDDVRVAYDSDLMCVVALNVTQRRMAVLWFGTGRVTEVHHLPFRAMESGAWPPVDSDGATDDDGTLKRRVMYLLSDPTSATTQGRASVWVQVHEAERGRMTVGETGIGFGTGEDSYTVTATANTTPSVTGDVILTLNNAGAIDLESVVGWAVVVTKSSTDSHVGRWYRVIATNGVATTTQLTVRAEDGAAVAITAGVAGTGDKVAIAPMHLRWVGPSIQGENPGPDRVLRVKQVTSVQAVFDDVVDNSTGTATAERTWRAGAWRGGDDTPVATGIPKTGGGVATEGVYEGVAPENVAFGIAGRVGKHGVVGTTMAVSIEVFCPGLDYRLVAAKAEGTLLGTDSPTRR